MMNGRLELPVQRVYEKREVQLATCIQRDDDVRKGRASYVKSL